MIPTMWRNKKNKMLYRYLGEVKHSETLEEMVLYSNELGERWVRPKALFFEKFEPAVIEYSEYDDQNWARE